MTLPGQGQAHLYTDMVPQAEGPPAELGHPAR